MQGSILDMVASEFGDVYDAPDPTWIAAALVTYKPIGWQNDEIRPLGPDLAKCRLTAG